MIKAVLQVKVLQMVRHSYHMHQATNYQQILSRGAASSHTAAPISYTRPLPRRTV